MINFLGCFHCLTQCTSIGETFSLDTQVRGYHCILWIGYIDVKNPSCNCIAIIKTSFAAGFLGSKKHLKIFPSSPNCKDTFPVPPIIAYTRHPSLRDLLVHSTLYKNTPHRQQPAGLYATVRAVSPVLFCRKAKKITFLPQLMSKENSLTTYPENPKILST